MRCFKASAFMRARPLNRAVGLGQAARAERDGTWRAQAASLWRGVTWSRTKAWMQASGRRPPIALAAQLLDQDIELVLDDTDGAGADLHEAQPAGFDEAFVKGGLADAEALQHLTFSQDSLAGHNGPTPLAPRRSRLLADCYDRCRRACKRHKNKGVALTHRKNPLPYLRERFAGEGAE